MEALEVGSSRNQEGIESLENKLDALMEGLAKDYGFLQMFSKIPQISLLMDFPLKKNVDPILEGNGPCDRD